MKQVSMKVNSANLVKSLKFSFTNKTTVLGELMQNARRANAIQVVFEFAPETKILRITDYGCGIDSIETLLTVAESGWDADVIAGEHPFGIGFLSALFACRHLTVVSKGGLISVDTQDVLEFKPVTVTPVTDWNGITSITMLGVNLELKEVQDTLNRLSRGFPLPVSLNDVFLERQYALDSGLRFVETEVGAIYLSGIDEPLGMGDEFDVYLQGLPIYRSHSYGSRNRHIIHLDSSRFYARLPDRDKLIDEADVVKLVKSVLTKEIEESLVLLKATVSAKEFVCFYEIMKHWGLLSLLNDVPVVPMQALHEFDDYPNCDTDAYGTFTSRLNASLTRSEVEAREVVNIDEDLQENGAARYMFARKRDALIYQGGLDNGHWVHSMVRNLDDEELTIELVNETHGALFEGDWISVYVRFCDAYRIKIGNDVVEVTGDAFYRGQENYDDAIVPKGDASGYVLKQISSYRSEYEDFQESTHETDMYAFESFVVANISSDPADAMKRLLPGFSGCPSLYCKSFVITLNDSGSVASVTLA
jgi:hypothetical protein